MHISKLQLVNYRNFQNADIVFKKGINTIIGENGSGKTNLFRAIRLLLDDNLLRMAYKLTERDFNRSIRDWRGHWIVISITFEEVSQEEAIQALFVHGTGNIQEDSIGKATYNLIFRPNISIRSKLGELESGDHESCVQLLQSIEIDDYETIFTGKSSADFTDPDQYRLLVGDFEKIVFPKELSPPEIGGKIPGILSISKEVSFTFVQALRDVVSDFQNNRTNPLLTLLKSKSGTIDAEEFKPVASLVTNLNKSIEGLSDVVSIRSDIRQTIGDAVGETYSPSSLSIKSELSDEADDLFRSLKLFVGELEDGYEGAIHELSLGGANLIYLTLKLLEFKYQQFKQSFANFLIIEEPEAHIHTHIQKTLFDKLDYKDTQIIYSTHSPQISEVSNVENINVLVRTEGKCESFQPAAGLNPKEIRNVQRYLDAVRSNLLFAKSVVLVEGDAEEILIPILVKNALGISLDELGISLVNIRSTGFQNIALLFHQNRIQKRCAILTDLDATFFDTTPIKNDIESVAKAKRKALASAKVGLARQEEINGFCQGNEWIEPFFAPHTFEVDFIAAGNGSDGADIAGEIYKDKAKIEIAKTELKSKEISIFGKRILTMANNSGKGWFAIQMGSVVSYNTYIPTYIFRALLFAHGTVDKIFLLSILHYRAAVILDFGVYPQTTIDEFTENLKCYQDDKINFETVRDDVRAKFPRDVINDFLDAIG